MKNKRNQKYDSLKRITITLDGKVYDEIKKYVAIAKIQNPKTNISSLINSLLTNYVKKN